jgi:hypothetical protein
MRRLYIFRGRYATDGPGILSPRGVKLAAARQGVSGPQECPGHDGRATTVALRPASSTTCWSLQRPTQDGWSRSDLACRRCGVKLAVEREMASTLIDFVDRRTARLLFSPDFGLAGAREAAQIMGVLLRWDEARTSAEVERYRAHADEHRVSPEKEPRGEGSGGLYAMSRSPLERR